MEIDAVGTFTMSRAAFDALRAAGSSVIINISATLHYGATWYQVTHRAARVCRLFGARVILSDCVFLCAVVCVRACVRACACVLVCVYA
jgi:NAD(P)-dependent dehydrogenase (short-subunit alcohol dehydrogenase family)